MPKETVTPQVLVYKDVVAKAREAVANGTLQATRAQTDEKFEGGCYNVHPENSEVKCVIGHSLDMDRIAEIVRMRPILDYVDVNATTFGNLQVVGLVRAASPKDAKLLNKLQMAHDDAANYPKHQYTNFLKLLEKDT